MTNTNQDNFTFDSQDKEHTSINHSMVLPREVGKRHSTANYGRFIISPLESGYGRTLGNTLRRILLSSLSGAAVTSIWVSDAPIDVTQLILRVKQLRFRLDGVERTRLRLEVCGEGIITAAEIWCPPEVKIINTELNLFTVDSPDFHVEMEFEVRSSQGYSMAEERGRLPIGELPIDAIFSPVRRVNYEVKDIRAGQHTNYDKLEIEVWTDGTIHAEAALSQGVQVLMGHLTTNSGIALDKIDVPIPETAVPMKPLCSEPDLSVRVFNSLKRTGITDLGEVIDMLQRGSDAMLAIRNFGEKSLDELIEKLQEKNYLPIEKNDE